MVEPSSDLPTGKVLCSKSCRFLEFFAGEGGLTAAVVKAGVPADPANDHFTGGVDFTDANEVNTVKDYIKGLHASGVQVMLHVAPPCATFSRARDRSWKTRLRSTARPQGLLGKGWQCRQANLIARNTLDLVEFAVAECGAVASFENPRSSYMWAFLDFDHTLDFNDVVFSPCMFGAGYRKPTRLRCWGWRPDVLDALCTTAGGTNACGRDSHEVLEFGGSSTAQAAAYHPEVCRWWAMEIKDFFSSLPDPLEVRDMASKHDHGRVLRHLLRGSEPESAAERREKEDALSTAGMRNPASLESRWPELWEVGADLRKILLYVRRMMPEAFAGLSGCCGKQPARDPPSDENVAWLRRALEKMLAAPLGAFDFSNDASPWRYGLVQAIQEATKDCDRILPTWLREGAPMGLTKEIQPGGHFPEAVAESSLSVAVLDKIPPRTENHPSWNEHYEHDEPPSYDLLREQVEAGFAILFESREAAEELLGGRVHPAPLGNVAKQKEDGSWKFRSIQDLRANHVNAAVRLPERQVLPRGLDHGRDLAVLHSQAKPHETVRTLVLDFKDAFMSIPLHPSEWRFNCANTGFLLKRRRGPLHEDEPVEGRFVVWRVLGFGGKPNPLVFSRAAAFAARTAQALLGPERREDRVDCEDIAYGKVQLYVDDPAVSLCGTDEQINASMDIVIMWWLALGIPLSWKKGEVFAEREAHRWIGIMYEIVDEGARMRLPSDFVKDLLERIEPLCCLHGSVPTSEMDVIVGKAARVAHVVPAARPFVAGLWGALSATRRSTDAGVFEAPAGRVPCRRFCFAASWIRALLRDDPDFPLPLERIVTPAPPPAASRSGWWIEFDASPFGGGAVLKNATGAAEEYFSTIWSNDDAAHLQVKTHDPAFQTFWEFCTLLLCLLTWGKHFVNESVVLYGDNTAALSGALSLKGKGNLLAVAREIAWRQAKHGWKFETAHLPSEHNQVADALSRIADPKGKAWPGLALAGARAVTPMKLHDLWLACPS